MSLRDAIERAASGREVPAAELEAAFGTIMDGEATPAQIAGLLIALRTKGETVPELVAAVRALRARADAAPLLDPATIDCCGTGGAPVKTFNISTTAAFVAAGAGARVGKHGNRAATSKSGSADVLEALGVAVDLPVQAAAEVLDEVGVAFFFARRAHPAMRHVAPVRAELGVRTMMNCLGPLLNPIGARRQLMGVYSERLVEPIAQVLRELGSDVAWVVHGNDGLDEITTTTTTRAARVDRGGVEVFEIDPADWDIPRADAADLAGGDAQTNAEITRAVLAGAGGPKSDIVAINAAAALVVAGKAGDLAAGLALARESIASGRASERLAALVEATGRRASA